MSLLTCDAAQVIVVAVLKKCRSAELVAHVKVLREISSVFLEAFDRNHFGASLLLQRLMKKRVRWREYSNFLSSTMQPALRATQRRRPDHRVTDALRWLAREHVRVNMAVNGLLEATELLQLGTGGPVCVSFSGVADRTVLPADFADSLARPRPRSGLPPGAYRLSSAPNPLAAEMKNTLNAAMHAHRMSFKYASLEVVLPN